MLLLLFFLWPHCVLHHPAVAIWELQQGHSLLLVNDVDITGFRKNITVV